MVADAFAWAGVWLACVLILGTVAFPLARRLMPGLTSRGAALSPALGMLLVSYVSWLLASVHLVPFGRTSVVLAVGIVAFVSAWSELAARGASFRWARRHVGTIAFFAAAFLVVFALFFWLRGYYPDVRSTEKPMEIGFLTSTMRARWMPPHDAWLSGYGINYYYFGYVQAAAVGLLAGLQPEVSFNLMSITLPALTFCGASGIAYDLLTRRRREQRQWHFSPRPLLAALVGGMLVAIAGNAYGFARFIQAPAEVLRANFWTGIGWNSSRVIYDHIVPDNATQMITEFPLFSFILGDIHPHVLALPTVLLAVGVAMGYWVRPAGWRSNAIGRYLLAALVIGALYPTNAWDLPTFALPILAAVALRRPEGSRRSAIKVGGLLVVSIVAFLPYWLNFKSIIGNAGDGPTFIQSLETTPGIGTIIRTFGLVVWPHTSLAQFLAFFAVPLAAAGTLIARGCAGRGWPLSNQEHRNLLVAVLAVSVVGLLTRTAALIPCGALVIAGSLAVTRPIARRATGGSAWSVWTPTDRAVTAIAVYGALLPIIPEFVFLRDAFDNRMNTMFKVDYQAWVLLMLAGAYGIVTLVWTARRDERVHAPRERGWQIAAISTGVTLLALVAATYPLVVPFQRTGHFGAEGTDFGGPGEGWQGIDGFHYVAETNSDEYSALLWLRDHAGPNDRLVEAPGNSYGEANGWFQSRFAAASGVSGVLGWYFHEVQWRGTTSQVTTRVLPERAADIGTLYTTTNAPDARRILAKYQITWVIVGLTEQDGEGRCAISLGCPPYPQPGLAKFSDMLELAYRQGRVSIYHVP